MYHFFSCIQDSPFYHQHCYFSELTLREADWHETEMQSPCACHADVMYSCILGVKLILKQLHKTFQTLSAFFGVELFLIMVWKPFCVEVNCIFGTIKLEYERCCPLWLVSVKDSRIFKVENWLIQKKLA